MRSIRGLIFVLAPIALLGQAAPPRLEFEVASIKASEQPGAGGQVNVGLRLDGAQVHIKYFSLKDYLGMAYNVRGYQISGPDWIGSDRFDIDAKLPAGAARGQIPDMLQALLADRFELKLHREKKDFPVHALVIGKGGLKMTEAKDEAGGETSDPARASVSVSASGNRNGVTVSLGPGSYYVFADNKLDAKKLTMASLADTLTRFMERPVVDLTNLAARYDFTLEFTPEDYRAMTIRSALAAGVQLPPEALRALVGVNDDSVLSAIEKLGLKLEHRKAPLDVLVIDHARKTPTEN